MLLRCFHTQGGLLRQVVIVVFGPGLYVLVLRCETYPPVEPRVGSCSLMYNGCALLFIPGECFSSALLT